MEATILLSSTENTRQVEDEERTRFVRMVLETMGLPLEDIWDEEGKLSLDGKIKFRNMLAKYGVQVIDNSDGEAKIYADKELIAKWDKPRYVLRKDASEIDPKRKLFLEMHICSWDIFEDVSKE